MMKSNIKSLLFSIIVVIAILAVAGGSTYAYFQWTTGEDQRTNLDVKIVTDGIEMVISPSNVSYANLLPDFQCFHGKDYTTTVTIKNKTGTLAVPSFKLKVKVVGKDGGGVPESALEHIHYAVTIWNEELEEDPSNDQYINIYNNGQYIEVRPLFMCYTDEAWGTKGTFSGVSETGGWSVLPRNGFLSGTYNSTTKTATGVTFIGEKKKPNEDVTTTTAMFRVWVWIDEEYKSVNVGNQVIDPLQGAKIYVTWSEESKIDQVTG